MPTNVILSPVGNGKGLTQHTALNAYSSLHTELQGGTDVKSKQ